MSKSVASESSEGHESRKMGGKRGVGDEENQDEEDTIEATSAATSAPPSWINKLRKSELRAELNERSVKFEKKDNKSILVELLHLRLLYEIGVLGGNNFLNTDDFRRLLVEFIPDDMLMTMRMISKPWSRVATGVIDHGVESGAMMVHDGNDHGDLYFEDYEEVTARVERLTFVTRVISLLNVVKFRECACHYAANLVVVDIPEGVESIGPVAFSRCTSLTTVSFPTTLTSIGNSSFVYCSSLDNIDLLHTNLQELGAQTFMFCYELKSMTIPDSLQSFGWQVFYNCWKLVPSNIVVHNHHVVSAVVAHLRLKQQNQI